MYFERFNRSVKSGFSVLMLLALLSSCVTTTKTLDWNATVKNVSNGVVSIHTDVPVSFDGKWNSSGHATGFIVDAQRGIILTNRHVVTPGPVTAKAILINNEEIELTPLYIDPVHDFGFYQYNPDHIKHLTPHEFKLTPESAHVGQEIRIIGNDAGQKISILDGTISRLDRDAPSYGQGTYNDFNTFYIQAATASTGGSSGSPVININGDVVALNAGSQRSSANAFYLPLTMVKTALKSIQQQEEITRGTLQTTFTAKPYAELKRLGLNDQLESQYRALAPELKGLFVIDNIIKQSPADQQLAIGDILLTVNQQPIVSFIALERLLNNNVDKIIAIEVLRAKAKIKINVPVTDLFSLSPTSYLKFDNSIFHNLSYQQARHYNKPISGVFVAYSSSYFKQAGLQNFSVITEFNGQQITNITKLNEQLKQVKNGEKIHTRYFNLYNANVLNYGLIEINRNWFEHSYCQKDLILGYWPCQEYNYSNGEIVKPDNQYFNSSTITAQEKHPIERSLVMAKFTSPYSIQGRNGDNERYGTGVIVDAEKGLVVVDRSTVFTILGDVKLTFANTLEIPAKVKYIHPIHNLALISYNPKDLGELPVASVKLSKEPLHNNQVILQAGLNYEGITEYRQTQVDIIQELWLRAFSVPQYVDLNIEVAYLVNSNDGIDGVLLNENNEVAGLWATIEQSDEQYKGKANFMAGIQAEYIAELITLAENKQSLYSLETSFTYISPVFALQRGLPQTWLNKVLATSANKSKLLAISNIAASTPSAGVFKQGDLLLAIDDQPVSAFRQVELLSQKPKVKVTLFRDGKVLHDEVATVSLTGHDITQVFFWSGLHIHALHRPAQMQRNVDNEGVYLASYKYGSPASRYKLYAMRKIVEIDGVNIESPDDFLQAVKNKKHQQSVVIKTLDFDNKINLVTLKIDNHYWPFYEVKYEHGQWHKINHLTEK
ncbi:MAG: trypsin-like peptidase domain-containing protein [Thalassotalea sp.]